MAVTEFQRKICQLLAEDRKTSGESYIAGGVALNSFANSPRLSRDIDIFHDTVEALEVSFTQDSALLKNNGYNVSVSHETNSFVNAIVSKNKSTVLLQWVKDSAFRFFPLVEHPDFGLAAHPFDLATNKVLALGGRLEIKDWVDTIYASENIQHLGFLVYAACGKDPGFNPQSLLYEAGRSSRYSLEEFETELVFEGKVPDFLFITKKWKKFISEAKEIVKQLPAEQAGECVLNPKLMLYKYSNLKKLKQDLKNVKLLFHKGSIKGILPRILPNNTGKT